MTTTMRIRRSPVTDLAGHLMWTRSGTVWATWRLSGLRYSGTIADKRAVRDLHRLLIRSLDGEALLLSYMLSEDPVQVVERMIEGVDLAQTPGWVEECEATLDALEDIPMGERFHWLAVPLANTGWERWTTAARAAWRDFKDRLDVPLAHRAPADVQARVVQAAQIESLIPAPFRPRQVSVAEQAWIANHAQRRGMLDEPVPAQIPQDMHPGADLVSAAVISEPVLDEGARSDLVDAGAFAKVNVLRQRVLKVAHPATPASHQAILAVAETPSGGLTFPGSEFLLHLDQTGYDVDWAIRLRINSREKVLPRNRKAVKDLNEQFDHRDKEEAQGTGLHDLRLAAELLTEYDKIFADDKLEVEVEHTMLFALGVARTSPEQSDAELTSLVDEHAHALTKTLKDSVGMRLERIAGHQSELWWGMQPGSPRTPMIKTYAQFTSSEHFSKLVPFVGNQLGGQRGAAFALNKGTSRPQVVHVDLAGYPELDVSGAILAVGEMGAGKSVLLKTCASDLVDKGGQWWAIDKSEDGEWAVFARTFESHQVVDAMDPQVTMDPLMTLPAEQAGDVLRTFLVQLLNIDTTGGLGVVLGQVTEAAYLQGHQITSSAQLCAHLADGGCDLPDEEDRRLARQLGQAMRNWTKTGVARVIFDDSLPPVDLTVSATAWRTHGMEQPTDREMSNEHLFKQLPPEKVFGRAYYRMLCRLARRLCFADRSRAAAFVTDEMYDITQNSENVGDIQHFLRRGRRPKALLLAGTHDVGDLHDEVLAGLIPTRVLVRHRDAGLAANGLRWLGIKEDDPAWADMLKKVTEDLAPVQGDQGVPLERRGEAFLRDAFGGIGLVKILPPARPSRRAAVFTTPPKSRSAA